MSPLPELKLTRGRSILHFIEVQCGTRMETLQKEDITKVDEASDQGHDTEKVSSVWVSVYDKTGERAQHTQWVIKEQPVSLVLNGRELVTLLCAGHHLDELAAGFLHGEGFLQRPGDLSKLQVDQVAGKVEVERSNDASLVDKLWMKRTITSGCGKGSLFYYVLDALRSKPVESALRITPEQVLGRVEDLNRLSETYRRTHGVHNTALATPREIILFRDDIGRHNAVDMIVGHLLDAGFDIAVRTGLHCAPLAHRTLGTFPEGTVRVSPGYSTTQDEIEYFLKSLRSLLSRRR